MRRIRLTRRDGLLALGGLVAAVAIGVSLGDRGDDAPASPAVLSHIAHKNQDAAIDAAAHMKAQSEVASREADRRADRADLRAEAAAPAEPSEAPPPARTGQ